MPTCPNCGRYIPLGNNSCDCGTTIAYYGEDDHSSGYYDFPDRSMKIHMTLIFSMSCIMQASHDSFLI